MQKLLKAGGPLRASQTLLLRGIKAGGSEHLLLVGCGARRSYGQKQLAAAASAATAQLAEAGFANATSFLISADLDPYLATRTTTQAVRASIYRFSELKSKAEPAPRLARLTIVVDQASAAAAKRGLNDGVAIADGMDLARDLGNRPANVCTPTHLAENAVQIAKLHKNVRTRVLNEAAMKKLGMGALLSVTRGALEPARLIVIEYTGGKANDAPVVLCGKGVTFDTGGISLKPPPKMDEMKFDMCGAAAVIGTMLSIAQLGLKQNVVAIVPACENMPGSQATRPGDIVTSMSGQTIEILNTDAEGRLILSDALTYADRYQPRAILDVATLTGACVVALGPLYTGLFSNNEELAHELKAASERALDAAWPMPVDEEYGESLRSNFADLANAGSREGGASIAAQFLSRFVGDRPWAHLDIAGVAWRQGQAKGATGRPVPMLVDYLLNLSSQTAAA
jgi:leucyl aminopeptidase